MKKAIVIGCSGSGKSTFSKKLRDMTGLPLYHLDMIWHKPDKSTVTTDQFDSALSDILVKDEWIIDGNYNRTLEVRIKEADTVFVFDLPVEVCIDGVENRIGKPRDDMPWTETEFDPEFRKWIEDFEKDHLPTLYRYISEYGNGKDIVIFKSRDEADSYIESLK